MNTRDEFLTNNDPILKRELEQTRQKGCARREGTHVPLARRRRAGDRPALIDPEAPRRRGRSNCRNATRDKDMTDERTAPDGGLSRWTTHTAGRKIGGDMRGTSRAHSE